MEEGSSPVTKKQKVETNTSETDGLISKVTEGSLLPLVSDLKTSDSTLRRFRRKLLNNKVGQNKSFALILIEKKRNWQIYFFDIRPCYQVRDSPLIT